jgi:hypothetical protein
MCVPPIVETPMVKNCTDGWYTLGNDISKLVFSFRIEPFAFVLNVDDTVCIVVS